MVVIVDTSGLIAAVNAHSTHHRQTIDLLDEMGQREDSLLVVSPFVLAEADYLLCEREGRPDVALEILRDVASGGYHLASFEPADIDSAADTIERYADQNIGVADASNVVLAYRYDTLDILTLDERHFRVLTGPRDTPFHLLPMDR